MATASNVILDDRLLIEEILVGLNLKGNRYTTSYWFYSVCRGASAGAGGHLAGLFLGFDEHHQASAIRSMRSLPDTISLPESRATVPVMAELSERHPRLNPVNLEAAAAGLLLRATILLSVEASRNVLPEVRDAENIKWRTLEIL